MKRAARILAVGTLVVSVFGTYHAASPAHHGSHVVVPPGQPAPRVGPSYLYPDPETTPGATHPRVTEANIQQTICMRGWTGTSRLPTSYTENLKKPQLPTARPTDKKPAH